MSFHRILVALDSSPRAPSVLAAAVELARCCGARLVLFRAVGLPVEMASETFVLAPDDLQAFLEKRARAELVELGESTPSGLVDGIDVRVGTPWQAICAAARTSTIDLIVIGSHGHRALDTLLGTNAARVVNHAGCSVCVIRPLERPPAVSG